MSASPFDITSNLSEEELQNIVADEIVRRSRRSQPTVAPEAVPSVVGAGTLLGKDIVHGKLIDTLLGEFEDIRNDPERQARQMDQMERTYQQYLDQGNNPVELFIPRKDTWAAWQDPQGNDVVWYDPSAPHAAVMAHELGHVQMNHSDDVLSQLQTSGAGKLSGQFALPVGAAAGAAGAYIGGNYNRPRVGAALGAALGALGGSGNFAYELGGASGRAMDYLPEDVDKEDAYGDLFRAGMTYGMAPAGGLIAGLTAGGIVNARRKARMAGQVFS